MTVLKIMDFKENDLFQENEQNEHISVKLQILRDFKREPHTVWCIFQWIFIKSPDFSEITDFSDSNGFLKESLLPKKEQNEHISMKSRKLQNYQILANFQKRASYRLVYLHEKLSIFI